jgi:Uma2 family endonuclease
MSPRKRKEQKTEKGIPFSCALFCSSFLSARSTGFQMSTAPHDKIRLTYADYVGYPDDGMRHEIIDGDHYMNPAPSPYHQTLSKRLQYQLYSKIELPGLGQVFDAPIDVQLSEHDIVRPDLIVVLPDSQARITPSRIKGPPDLVVEILSPSTAGNDQGLKRTVYEKFGVREYWIVDPTENTLTLLESIDGTYRPRNSGDDVPLVILPDLVVSFSHVW